MSSDKHYLNFSVPAKIMKNCVKKAICNSLTTKNDTVLREDNISLSSCDRHIVPSNAHLISCNALSKNFTHSHAFEEIDQDLVNDHKFRNKVEPNEKIPSQDICQNVFNEWSSSRCDEKNLTSSSVQSKRKDSSTTEILQRYFAICDSYLTDDFCDLVDRGDITIGSSEERDRVDDNIEMRSRLSVTKESTPSGHKLTLNLSRCNSVTDHELSKSDQKSEESNEERKHDVIIPTSIADICWNALLYSVNDKTPEKYAIHFLKKQEEEQFAFSSFDENTCQRTSVCSFRHVTEEEQVQLQPKKCNRIAGPTATEQLANDLLILIRQMYHAERCMLFIGLTDVISSMEQNLAEFIVLAENATHLLAPLNFLTRLIKLAEVKNIPYIRTCTKEQLGQACCVSTDISAVSIKIGPSYFSKKIKNIKRTITNVT